MKKAESYRPRFFGAGTVVVIIAAISVGLFRMHTRPPEMKRLPAAKKVAFKLPRKAAADKMFNSAEKLGLDKTQIEKLRELHAEWRNAAAPLEDEMKRLDAETSKWLDSAKKPTLDEIREKAGPMSDATAAWLRLDAEFERRAALEILTPQQRAAWDKLRGPMRVLKSP